MIAFDIDKIRQAVFVISVLIMLARLDNDLTTINKTIEKSVQSCTVEHNVPPDKMDKNKDVLWHHPPPYQNRKSHS